MFKAAVRAYAVALADGLGRWGYETAVKDQPARHKLDAGTIFSVYAESVKAGGLRVTAVLDRFTSTTGSAASAPAGSQVGAAGARRGA